MSPPVPAGESDAFLTETIATYDAAHEFYAERFAQFDLSSHITRFVASLAPGDGLVLDAGCGAGRDLAELHRRGLSAIGLDRSRGLLEHCDRSLGIPLIQADIRRLPIASGSIRGVWLCAVLVHLEPADAVVALAEACRVLAARGTVFVATAAGRGERWRTDVVGRRRWFHYYDLTEVLGMLRNAGLRPLWANTELGQAGGTWINAIAERPT